ncbi:NADP oxidoreductase [Thiomicrorhabdus sp.]|uniref:NADP oxidoreductase n=1 Tax=Thiomicrorhabdus sp. TaxID=2039724 RepID=UPI0029C8B993|nr:NADP oxidoreductase [Thiomicrorhabdus sp.]
MQNFIVLEQYCLTPDSTHKEVFWLNLTPLDDSQKLDYQPGDWLCVKAYNPQSLVSALLERLSLSPQQLVTLRRAGEVTVECALSEHLEITQLNPAILNKLQRSYGLGEWEDRHAMIDYAEGKDILDLLDAFPQIAEMGEEALSLLSPLAPRFYSIASMNKDNSVSILYKLVAYENAERHRHGAATGMMKRFAVGDVVSAELRPNPGFKLPPDSTVPVIMIGAGTGVAPFIGFMQQREQQQAQDNLLFFGETTQAEHCLCCEQLEAWQKAGLLKCYFAFSRDQAHKVYVQQRLWEQKSEVWQGLQQGAHLYICGSQNNLMDSVHRTLLAILESEVDLDGEAAEAYLKEMKKQKRLQLDVY